MSYPGEILLLWQIKNPYENKNLPGDRIGSFYAVCILQKKMARNPK